MYLLVLTLFQSRGQFALVAPVMDCLWCQNKNESLMLHSDPPDVICLIATSPFLVFRDTENLETNMYRVGQQHAPCGHLQLRCLCSKPCLSSLVPLKWKTSSMNLQFSSTWWMPFESLCVYLSSSLDCIFYQSLQDLIWLCIFDVVKTVECICQIIRFSFIGQVCVHLQGISLCFCCF